MSYVRIRRLLAALAVLVLAACHTLPESIEPPIVHLADLRVRDAQLLEQRYTLVLRVQNPNPHRLPLDGMSYKVLLNQVELGRGASRTPVTLPPYGEKTVEVDVVSNMFSLLHRVQAIANGTGDGVSVSIIGNVNLENHPAPVPFSFHAEIGGRRS